MKSSELKTSEVWLVKRVIKATGIRRGDPDREYLESYAFKEYLRFRKKKRIEFWSTPDLYLQQKNPKEPHPEAFEWLSNRVQNERHRGWHYLREDAKPGEQQASRFKWIDDNIVTGKARQQRILGNLDMDERQVLYLYFAAGMALEFIAEELDVSVEWVVLTIKKINYLIKE